MRRQNEMMDSFLSGHRNFIASLNQSLDMIEKDIDEMTKTENVCVDGWYFPVELCLDEVAKNIYSISEPRWSSGKRSETLRKARRRVHNLYTKYRSIARA